MNYLALMILMALGAAWFLMVPVAVVTFPFGIVRWLNTKPRPQISFLKLLVGVPFTLGLLLIYNLYVGPFSVDPVTPVPDILLNEALALGLVALLLIGNLAALVYQLKDCQKRTGTITGSITLAHYCCNAMLVLPILHRHATMTMT